jgi:hypothetical protein
MGLARRPSVENQEMTSAREKAIRSRRRTQGSFDSAETSLHEVPAPLRMTVLDGERVARTSARPVRPGAPVCPGGGGREGRERPPEDSGFARPRSHFSSVLSLIRSLRANTAREQRSFLRVSRRSFESTLGSGATSTLQVRKVSLPSWWFFIAVGRGEFVEHDVVGAEIQKILRP